MWAVERAERAAGWFWDGTCWFFADVEGFGRAFFDGICEVCFLELFEGSPFCDEKPNLT
jgi:hypothetical protein